MFGGSYHHLVACLRIPTGMLLEQRVASIAAALGHVALSMPSGSDEMLPTTPLFNPDNSVV